MNKLLGILYIIFRQSSERHLREALRAEATRAEVAEAERDAALRLKVEACGNAAAAASSAAQAAATLTKVLDELAATKMQFELAVFFRILDSSSLNKLQIRVHNRISYSYLKASSRIDT